MTMVTCRRTRGRGRREGRRGGGESRAVHVRPVAKAVNQARKLPLSVHKARLIK